MRKAFSLSITLWISAALMAGAIYFIKITKQNIVISSSLQDKLQSSIELYSTSELLKYYLILGKCEFNKIKNKNQSLFPKSLPIDATPFKHGNSTITIQDSGGLLNTMYPQSFLPKATRILNENNYAIVKDSLDDWLDTNSFYKINGAEKYYYKDRKCKYEPRNSKYLYHSSELDNIRGFKDLNLSNQFIHSFIYGLNYYTMSELVLQIKYNISKEDAKVLVKARRNNINDYTYMFNRVEKVIEDPLEDTLSYSKVFKVTIVTTVNNATSSLVALVDYKNNINLYLYYD